MTEIELLQSTWLAFIQGLTEFLPISSSAHLLLPSVLLGWEDQGLAFDVAVHLGTLMAVIIYFHRMLRAMACDWGRSLVGRPHGEKARLGWLLILASLPVVVCGLLLRDIVDAHFRSGLVIAGTTVLFALVLWWADARSRGNKGLHDINWRVALLVGLGQVLALIPGTSRSGITMSVALLCHLDREAASRFSFLLSIPVIAGAALLLGIELIESARVNWLLLTYATLLSGIVAFSCIHLFLKIIDAVGFLPFVIYRLLLGVLVLWVIA